MAAASAVLICLFVVRWRWPRAWPLLAMLLATAAVAAFGLSGRGVNVVGPIPAGLPVPRLPDVRWHELRELLLPAFSVMIVAFNRLPTRATACEADRVRTMARWLG